MTTWTTSNMYYCTHHWKKHRHPRQLKNQTSGWPKNLAQPKNKVSENCYPYAQLAAPKQLLGAPWPSLTASCSHSALLGSSQGTTTWGWASRKVFADLLIFPFELLPFFMYFQCKEASFSSVWLLTSLLSLALLLLEYGPRFRRAVASVCWKLLAMGFSAMLFIGLARYKVNAVGSLLLTHHSRRVWPVASVFWSPQTRTCSSTACSRPPQSSLLQSLLLSSVPYIWNNADRQVWSWAGFQPHASDLQFASGPFQQKTLQNVKKHHPREKSEKHFNT